MGLQGVNGANRPNKAESINNNNNQVGSIGSKPIKREKTEDCIETESYLKNCQNRWSGFTGNHGPNATPEENAKYEEWQKMNYVINNVEFEVCDDGSAKFRFKKDVNVEDFKKAFGIKSDGNFIGYLNKRHNDDVKSGKVHAIYTNGAQTEHEQRAIYNTSGKGAVIKYTDGYSEKKQAHRFFFSGLYDSPDYRNMKFGAYDTENLPPLSKNFFRESE